jgi:hypothetical protein
MRLRTSHHGSIKREVLAPNHVKIRTPEDLDQPALRRLVEIATTHRVPPLPGAK